MPGPVNDSAPSLADRMRSYGDRHPEAKEELAKLADGMDAADWTDVKKSLGIWARTRRRWSEISGEPLI